MPSSATGFVTPVPLVAMGRFNHEAAAVDPNTGYVYMTEDRSDGLLYRFVPNTRNNLSSGGALYALRISAKPKANTTTGFIVGQSHAVNWVRITNPDPATDTIRATGFNLGAAKFARGEGIFYSNGDIYFSCTSGGSAGVGQVWRYTPATETLRLYIQPNNAGILDFPDNIVVAPNGDLFLCEDGGGTDFIVGVTPSGSLYKFARNRLNSNELTGVCFSPNGQIMFVNMQTPGITFAISGPW